MRRRGGNLEGGYRMTGSSKAADMRAGGNLAYRAGVAVAVVASFLTVWTTIVRDNGEGEAFFLLIMAIGVGWFTARFRAADMVRTMLGVAVMQVILTILIVTAPVTATEPDGVFKAWLSGGVFTGMWLVSAAFFRVAAKGDR
jgi:hypothetical protein